MTPPRAQVGPGTVVDLSYEVFDEEGDRVGGSREGTPFVYVHGYGQLLPALEAALEGLEAGGGREVTLGPDDAFGPRDQEELLEIAREDLPDVVLEDELEVETEDGEAVFAKVIEVWDDFVLVDTNHPLAGMTLRFVATVEDVRVASDEELTVAAEALQAQSRDVAPRRAAPPLVTLRRKG